MKAKCDLLMHVLLLNQFFWPDSATTGCLLEDVARELVSRGCTVSVVCGSGTYVATDRLEACPPVQIYRMPRIPYSRHPVGRVLSWVTFLIWATVRSLLLPRTDLAIALTSPPGLSAAGWLLKKLRGTRFWSWEMDVYPDVAIGVGTMRKDAVLTRILASALNFPRHAADGVIALGSCMKQRIVDQGANAERVFVAENWSDGRSIVPAPFPTQTPLIIQYSGNLGLAHEFQTISSAMLELRDSEQFRFEFIGSGARRQELGDFVSTNGLSSVRFRQYAPKSSVGDNLSTCHLGLVTLRPECLGTVVPSKVYAILAAGRPILFIGPASSTPAELIREHACGWHIESGDAAGAVSLLRHLAAQPELVIEAGRRARRLFELFYDTPKGAARVADLLVGPRFIPAAENEQDVDRRLVAARP